MLDVVIIGSGFAGLVAARILTQAKRSVLVLEAQSRAGGRCLTSNAFPAPVDIGCSWIHGWAEGTPVRDLVNELGISTYVPPTGTNVILGPQGILDAPLAKRLSDNLAAANASAAARAHADASPEISTASHLFAADSPLFSGLSAAEKPLAEGLARSAEVGLGLPLEQLALKWTGYEDAHKGTDAGPVGGYTRVIEALIEEIRSGGGTIQLGARATLVNAPDPADRASSVVVETDEGGAEKTYEARLVISSIPLGVLKRVHEGLFRPALSDRKREAIAGTHVGQLGKLVMSYDAAWWGDEIASMVILPNAPGTSGSADKQDAAALLDSATLVAASFAVKTSALPHNTILVYLPAPVATALEALPADKVAAAAHALLVARLPQVSPAAPPRHNIVTSWSSDPYSYGATSTPPLAAKGRSPLDFVELGRPEAGPRVLMAGEHTSLNNRGSVAGAVESGIREGQRAARLLQNWQTYS